MPRKKRILIISNSEVCYHARLLKAAEYLYTHEFDVTVYNPVTGFAPADVYEEYLRTSRWKTIQTDINKRSLISCYRWFIASILNKLIRSLWSLFRLSPGTSYYFIKGLIFFPAKLKKQQFDFILIHLIDTLPFAAKIKKTTGAKLIYDSQEYFRGQYSLASPHDKAWVYKQEQKHISAVDILLATTRVMLEQIISDYQLQIPSFRLRNLPLKRHFDFPAAKENEGLQLVWHGMTIFLNNRRGVHLLIDAIALCTAPVVLTLQGLINNEQTGILNDYLIRLGLSGKVNVLKPAPPDKIVESLIKYDAGLIGEIPEEENQQLTSSNKLFDFINAGLAVIAPDIPGLNETLDEFNIGIKYEAGNAQSLAAAIDTLAMNHALLNQFKKKSQESARQFLYWEADYEPILKFLKEDE